MRTTSLFAGLITGITVLGAAVPALAATTDTVSKAARPAITQACVTAMANAEEAKLSNMDAMHAAMKTAMSAHRDALRLAAQIEDDTSRADALREARKHFQEAMEASRPDSADATMQAVKTACGERMPMMHGSLPGHGMGKRGTHGKGMKRGQ